MNHIFRNLKRASLQRLRPGATCMGAFAAGCLFVGSVFGQQTETQQASTLDRLFSSEEVSTPQLETKTAPVPEAFHSPSPLRPMKRAVKKTEGPTASDIIGSVQHANRPVDVQQQVQPSASQATWNAPALPDYPNVDDIQVAPIERPNYRRTTQPPITPSAIEAPTMATVPAARQLPGSGTVNEIPDAPVARVAKAAGPVATVPGVHQIRNIDLRSFENKVISVWGDRLSAKASADGRFVEVEMPTKVAGKMRMTIDRKEQTLKYDGDESLRDNWHHIMNVLDSSPVRTASGEVIQAMLVDTQKTSGKFIQQVAMVMGFAQDQEKQEGISIPQDLTQDQLDALAQQAQGLKGSVQIVEDERTGALTLVGSKEDLAILRKVIDSIVKQTSDKQPITKRIPLENIQSESVSENIQQMYDEGYASSNGPAIIIPQPNPNQLIVIGQPKGVEAIEKIVGEMDVAGTEDEMGGFKAFRLKHLSAADARDRLQSYFNQANLPAGDNQLPTAPVTVVADFRSNTVIVKGASQFIKQAEDFLATIDVDTTDNTKDVRVFQLKNTLAEEMAIVLQDTLNGSQPNAVPGYNPNQNAQNLQNNNQNTQASPTQSQLGSSGLTLQTKGQNGEIIKSSILFEVRVAADRNSNSLVVTAPASSMDFIAELVKQLDRLPNAETQIKVFEIVNGDADALLDMLEALFGADQTQAAGGGAGAGGTSNLSQLPLQGASGTDGQTLVNLRFSVDPRTNTIIASGPAGDLQVVEDLLNRLDASDVQKSMTQVYRLSNAPALDISDAINEWLDTRNDIINEDPRSNLGVPLTNRAINVVPEVVSNSLIVTARPEYRAEIESIIKALDRRPPMVKVKVLIAEVNLNSLEEFGVELGIQDSLLFDRGTIVDAAGAITGGIGFPFNSNQTANANNTFQGDLASQALSNLGLGKINSDLGYGGLVLSGGSDSVNILIRALKDRQCVRVLSKPHIMTIENLQGRIAIGAEVPRVSGTTQTNFGTTQNVTFVDVGVILEVTPRVSPDGLIVMAVNAKRSSVGGPETGITIGFGSSGEPIIAPQIIETEANTTLMSRSGQTVVFSGLIQENKSHSERGAPILSDLPLLGPLFKFESDEASRTELLIIMTPYLVTDEQDIAMVNQDETERMHWCECDVADVYGAMGHGRSLDSQNDVETVHPFSDPTGVQPVSVDAPRPVMESSAAPVEVQAEPKATQERPVRRSAARSRGGIFGR